MRNIKKEYWIPACAGMTMLIVLPDITTQPRMPGNKSKGCKIKIKEFLTQHGYLAILPNTIKEK